MGNIAFVVPSMVKLIRDESVHFQIRSVLKIYFERKWLMDKYVVYRFMIGSAFLVESAIHLVHMMRRGSGYSSTGEVLFGYCKGGLLLLLLFKM